MVFNFLKRKRKYVQFQYRFCSNCTPQINELIKNINSMHNLGIEATFTKIEIIAEKEEIS